MHSIRIAAAGAALIMMVGGAAAQTATETPSSKPMSLLHVVQQPAKEKKARARIAHVRRAKDARRFAGRRTHLATTAPAPTTEPENVWPTAYAPTSADAAPAPQAAPPPAASDTVKAIDVDADEPHEANEINRTDAQPASTPIVALMQQFDRDGAAHSWMAEVMVTLGGAVTAGLVAWFLIGSAPQRRYG
jgi:hypothetical protein